MAVKWKPVGWRREGLGWSGAENDEEAQVGDVSLTVEEYADAWGFLVEVPTTARNIRGARGTRKTKVAAKRAAEAAGRRWALKQAKAWGLLPKGAK